MRKTMPRLPKFKVHVLASCPALVKRTFCSTKLGTRLLRKPLLAKWLRSVRTREYQTFLEWYCEIRERVGISDLRQVVAKLGLTTGQDSEADAILEEVGAKIQTDPEVFHQFVEALMAMGELAPFAESLNSALQSETVTGYNSSVNPPEDPGPDCTSRKRPEPISSTIDSPTRFTPTAFTKQRDDFTGTSRVSRDRVSMLPTPGSPTSTGSSGSSSSYEEQLESAAESSEKVKILQHRVEREKEKRHKITEKLQSELTEAKQSLVETEKSLAKTENNLAETKQKLAEREELSYNQIDSLTRELSQCKLDYKQLEEESRKFTILYDESKKDKEQLEDEITKLKKAMEEIADKTEVLEEALSLSTRSLEFPQELHLRLVEHGVLLQDEENDSLDVEVDSGTTSTMTVGPRRCPFRENVGHQNFRDLLVMNIIQARGTVCLGCRKKLVRINSHPYGKAILEEAIAFGLKIPKAEAKKQQVILRNDIRTQPITAASCTYPYQREAFCRKCDNSTSELEGELVQKFGKDPHPESLQSLLLVQMFRGAILSIDLTHYLECQPCGRIAEDVARTMLDLMRFHEAVCSNAEVAHDSLKVAFHFDMSHPGEHKIEYPLVVDLENIGPVIYSQIPPYYWAVPTDPEKADVLKQHFPDIIGRVNVRLSIELRYFFEQDEDAVKWRDGLDKEGIVPMLVHRYLPSCYLDEHTPVEQ